MTEEIRLSKDQLVSKLQSDGLVFSEFSLVHEGDYSPEDGEWNYKDLSHIDRAHRLIRPVFSFVGHDMLGSICFQKILGMRFIITLVNYESDPKTLTYHMSWLFFVFIIQTKYEETLSKKAKVVTTYSIGSPRLLRFCFPVIRWIVKRNYDNLMSGDIPMRERRGELRSWGYGFQKNSKSHSFLESLDVSGNNVIVPEDSTAAESEFSTDSIESDLADGNEKFLGRNDHLGLRFVRSADEILVFPRLCSHEGASLDKERCLNGKIRCPWHSRIFLPLARFDLKTAQAQKASTQFHEIVLENGRIKIHARRARSNPGP